MNNDRMIGKVTRVKSHQAQVELSAEIQSYSRGSYCGIYPIAAINSYIIIPVGSQRIVGIVTSLDMAEDQEASVQSRQILILPKARRTLWVSLVGTLVTGQESNQSRFEYGILTYPSLDNPVWFAAEEDLDIIFEKTCRDKHRATKMISIGKSPLFPDYDVKINMDRFFGKHAAILGNTGSGKSCTVTAIIRSVMEHKNGNGMPNAHFIIFDTNAEYEAAFTNIADDKKETKLFNRLVIKNDGDEPSGMWVPHWFMNGRDINAFFKPGEGAQSPLLHSAIGLARAGANAKSFCHGIMQIIDTAIGLIEGYLQNPPAGNQACFGKKNLNEVVIDLKNSLASQKHFFDQYKLQDSWEEYCQCCEQILIHSQTDKNGIGQLLATDIGQIRNATNKMKERYLNDNGSVVFHIEDTLEFVGIDTPVYYDYTKFVETIFREELERQAKSNPQLRNYIGTLILRLEQAKADPRYKFMFSPSNFSNALASFLRLCTGVDPNNEIAQDCPWREGYLKQYPEPCKTHNVTILDFSQLASDVLENVTALIGRLLLEFMQKCPDRGKFPIVLVLEEAHHYIPANAINERQQRAREVFERIAKEGRKYGLSLVVASQRPSELSRTVLAQCNSFIVHRIQNPDDQEYFRSVVSDINRDLLDQLPTLPQQHALVLGDCTVLPLQVKISDVSPKPDSHDPEFFSIWSDPNVLPPDFDVICKKWECYQTETACECVSVPPVVLKDIADDEEMPF